MWSKILDEQIGTDDCKELPIPDFSKLGWIKKTENEVDYSDDEKSENYYNELDIFDMLPDNVKHLCPLQKRNACKSYQCLRKVL